MQHTKLLWSIVIALSLGMLWLISRPVHQTQVAVPGNPDSGSETQASSLPLTKRIETLEDELTREILLRQELERRLARLEQRDPAQPRSANMPAAEREPRRTPQNNSSSTETVTQDNRRLSEKLVSLGLPSDTAQVIQDRIDRNQLAMLELRNQAVREGWSDSAEFIERMHDMRNASGDLREEFGDEIYDKYLYASGVPNRIRVREVFSGSAAEIAGLQAGDIVLNYADANIFSMSELRKSTTEGRAGENILVKVIRDDQPVSFSITRGPIGISMEMVRSQPR